MAVRFSDAFPIDEVRYEPTPKRIRALCRGRAVVDSDRAVLVWDAGNTVPTYAFPPEDVDAGALDSDVLHRWSGDGIDGRVSVPWDAAERWLEEDDELVGHPRDPFHRVDVRPSSRHVTVSLDGAQLADTRRPVLVFETGLPVRFYLLRDDVRTDLLEPSDTRSACAYKGIASYLALDGRDVAWTYEDPLPDNRRLQGLVCFFNERTDITVDGRPAGRPTTQWS